MSLLDLSAAFDTTDHDILLSRLHHTFGISGTALSWFHSYLTDRKQVVTVNSQSSAPSVLKYGVPQGSVLGPVLFVLYTQPLSDIVHHHSLSHHSYSDDNQLYKSGNILQLPAIIQTTQLCISDLKDWMTNNKLKLNEEKTEMIFVTPKRTCSNSLPLTIDLNGTEITPSQTVRNLGVYLDQHLSFQQQVTKVCQTCYTELRRISCIRHYLSGNATKTLVCAFILSRLDYCNSLLAGCPKYILDKLQKVQNHAARLIYKSPRSAHVSPLFQDLHWLPVENRIEYKLASLCFRSIEGTGPQYLSDLINLYIPSRELRSSSDTRMLRIPTFRMTSNGQRSFTYQGPHTWNQLPQNIRHASSLQSFKSSLKTHLFPTA